MITIENIKEVVCQEVNKTPASTTREFMPVIPAMINYKTRKREVVEARQFCHYFAPIYMPDLTLHEIGRKFGEVDHSTVIASRRNLNDLIETDKRVRDIYNRIDSILKKGFGINYTPDLLRYKLSASRRKCKILVK